MHRSLGKILAIKFDRLLTIKYHKSMIKEVVEYIEKNNMLKHGDKVVVGVSGGADSVCLLNVLYEIRKKYNLTLYVVHVNHGIRGNEALRDEQFVENMAKSMDVYYESRHVDVPNIAKELKQTEEEAGRICRYKIFDEICDSVEATKIAVAHNLNDNSETVLFNLFRGSKLKGLTGISPIRGKIIRPLLCCTRTQIEKYLSEKNIGYCVDSTNNDNEYSRNKIRLDLLPFIKEHINPKAEYNIASAASGLSEVYEYINAQAQDMYNQVVSQNILLNRAKDLPKVLLKEVIRQWIDNNIGKLKDITGTHIEMVADLLENQVSKQINLPYNMTFIKTYQGIELHIFNEDNIIKNGEKSPANATSKDNRSSAGATANNKKLSVGATANNKKLSNNIVKKENEVLVKDNSLNSTAHFQLSLENQQLDRENIPDLVYTKWLDYDKINELTVRTKMAGDYIVINKKGGKKNLKKFFVDSKIPKETRDNILLLADGSEIVWIVGYRISEKYKVTKETKNILKIIYNKE